MKTKNIDNKIKNVAKTSVSIKKSAPNISVGTENLIENVEINIQPFLPLFYNHAKDIYNHILDENNIENPIDYAIGKPARFMYQRHLKTGKEGMVCESVMSTVLDKNEVKIDFAFGWNNESKEESKSLMKFSKEHLDHFYIYKALVINRNIKPNELGSYLKENISARELTDILSVRLYFLDVMEWLQNTCISENRIFEKITKKIIYRDKNTGWNCTFSVKERYDNGKPKKLLLRNFYNIKIDTELIGVRWSSKVLSLS